MSWFARLFSRKQLETDLGKDSHGSLPEECMVIRYGDRRVWGIHIVVSKRSI